ncbi:hypothetical protein IAQ67_28415 (plasmid) [Paenibacillus peoriae]|uniref:Uncharacterized protein n=1 Tax=Paenibacillus peoriae TaxID=59893 RepID=A0A7H0YH85_9BACL|nr:hypothetical protein IAQ67_28415 [Paenibacillus peoriae]
MIIYEVSISYEGKPQKFIKRIKFSDIVGNPVSDRQLDKGYEFETPQGEKLLVKWHLGSSNEQGGLIIHNRSVKGTSYYEPNWGQVFGVGMEWLSCDGTTGGIMWANRHLGNTAGVENSDGTYKMNTTTFATTTEKDYSPNAVRPGLMLGNPEPYRALWVMGDLLPMRVYPALGQVHQGCIFGFNKNVMKWVYVKPPIPEFIDLSGEGTSRSDHITFSYRKSEFHEGYTVMSMQVVSDPSGLVTGTNVGSPNDRGVYILTSPTEGKTGSKGFTVYFGRGAGNVRIRAMVLETDNKGTPLYVLQCQEYEWKWASGSQCGVTTLECSGNLPYPEKPPQLCVGVDAPPNSGGGTTDPTPTPSTGYGFYCDGSVPPSSIDTSYWKGDKALSASTAAGVQSQYGVTISPNYWEGRNSWIELFAKMDSSTPYRNSKLSTITPFHQYLFKTLTEVKNQTAEPIESNTWAEFQSWCEANGLDCLTNLQKASLYMTYMLQVPVNFFSSASGYLSGNIIDVMVANLLLLPQGLMDWIDFNDVAVDSANSITGAFAADIPDPQFKAFSSFVNFEPQALQYTIDSAIAHRPFDYVKPAGSQWGSATSVNWQSYWLSEMTNANFKPYVAAEVGIHEIGHAVAYHGLDFYGKTLHERPDWLAISGWSSTAPSKSPNTVSTHLVKTRSAAQTGGLPKTDAGYEAPVSDYGCFHPAEDFAEAFRLYTLNPVFLEQKYPQKYKFMVDVVEPMFIT